MDTKKFKIRPIMKDYDRGTYSRDKHLFDLMEWSWWAEERIKELESLTALEEDKEEERKNDLIQFYVSASTSEDYSNGHFNIDEFAKEYIERNKTT